MSNSAVLFLLLGRQAHTKIDISFGVAKPHLKTIFYLRHAQRKTTEKNKCRDRKVVGVG
ncbi:hypothetical protein SAMN05421760_1166 [Neptunomonas antarctica]|uniref:Uncharacterized protein n=1 Tax=Neptunomonas antarctica TaxID=619304 RepID=A0A1N7PKQ4_9GAMM|nr:hypothetical protein SAMN05421760_1166 [Neptunomonas antarctica]